jgi:hypothetical protein
LLITKLNGVPLVEDLSWYPSARIAGVREDVSLLLKSFRAHYGRCKLVIKSYFVYSISLTKVFVVQDLPGNRFFISHSITAVAFVTSGSIDSEYGLQSYPSRCSQ